MWRGRWISAIGTIWVLGFLVGAASTAEPISATSRGATSEEEEGVLWEDGKAAFEKAMHLEASQKLQRLVDRYPANAHRPDSLLMLGRSYLAMDEYAAARMALQALVHMKSTQPIGIEGRVWLGQALLGLRKHSAAYLSALEVESLPSPPSIRAEALLVKSQALIGQGKDFRAERAADAASPWIKKVTDAQTASKLRARQYAVRLDLKLRECVLLPRPSRDERRIRNEIEQRGLCLMEASTLFKRQRDEGRTAADERLGLSAAQKLVQGWEDYARACAQPLVPSEGSPKQFKAELVDYITQTCRASFTTARDMVKDWPTGSPEVVLLNKLTQKIGAAL